MSCDGCRGTLQVVAVALAALAFAVGAKAAEAKSAKEAGPVTLASEDAAFANWVTLSIGQANVDGNEPAFQQRTGLPANTLFGGVEDFHYEHAVTAKSLLKLDGRGLMGVRDRELKFDLTQEERGFIRGGYTESRAFFNGSGGYFPGVNPGLPPGGSDLYTDRSRAWIEGGLTLSSESSARVRYSHDLRDGRKDSTIWGRINTPYGPRGVGASFHDLDERSDTIEGEFLHTIGKTQLGLQLNWEQSERDHSLNYQDFPGTPNSYLTQKESVNSEVSSIHVWSNTGLDDTTRLSGDYRYTRVEADLTGSRIFGPQFDSAYDPTGLRGPAYTNLFGDSLLSQHVAQFGYTFAPGKSLALVAGLKVGYQERDAAGQYQPSNPRVVSGTNLGGIVIPNQKATGLVSIASRSSETAIGPQLELRSTHVTNWLFHVRGEWEVVNGNLSEASRPLDAALLSAPPDTNFQRDSDNDRLLQKYSVGATWHPVRKFNLSARYDFRIRHNEYDHLLDTTANTATSFDRYPAYLRENEYSPQVFDLRATWRPMPSFTSVTRYDYKISTARTRADLLSTVESTNQTAHLISQSLAWSPSSRFYIQGSLNYVLDDATTPVDSTAAAPGPLPKAQNDYWFGNLGTGYALGKKTDLTVDLSYYLSENYDPTYYQFGLPLGASTQELLGGVGLSHRLSRHLRGTLRYSYRRSEDEASGGGNDFEAHQVSASIRYGF